jgi:hypothetical protein
MAVRHAEFGTGKGVSIMASAQTFGKRSVPPMDRRGLWAVFRAGKGHHSRRAYPRPPEAGWQLVAWHQEDAHDLGHQSPKTSSPVEYLVYQRLTSVSVMSHPHDEGDCAVGPDDGRLGADALEI